VLLKSTRTFAATLVAAEDRATPLVVEEEGVPVMGVAPLRARPGRGPETKSVE